MLHQPCPRMIATDIDGTITDEQGRIHLAALKAIRACEAAGIPVALVSGRPLPFVEALCLYAGTSGPIVAENGAVYRSEGREFQMGDPLLARRALDRLSESLPLKPTSDNIYRRVDVAVERTVPFEAIEQAVRSMDLRVAVQLTNVMIHLVDERVSKGATLLLLLDRLGYVPSDCAVFGDSPNDLPMFRIGARGMALANSSAELKAVAAYTASQPFGAGFAEGVRHLLGRDLPGLE